MNIPSIKNIKIGKKEVLLVLVLLVLSVAAVLIVRNSDSAQKGKRYSQSFIAVDSYVNVTCYGKLGNDTCKAVKKELTKMKGGDRGKALDSAADIIKEAGVKSSLVTIGEDVVCIGKRPDGKLWRVGVKNLGSEKSEMVGVLEISDLILTTVGDKDSKTSVTILSQSGLVADGFSSALVLMTPEAAADYWRENGGETEMNFEMIFVKDDTIYATKGIKDNFSSDEDIIWIE